MSTTNKQYYTHLLSKLHIKHFNTTQSYCDRINVSANKSSAIHSVAWFLVHVQLFRPGPWRLVTSRHSNAHNLSLSLYQWRTQQGFG
jgi:hypothetical protein